MEIKWFNNCTDSSPPHDLRAAPIKLKRKRPGGRANGRGKHRLNDSARNLDDSRMASSENDDSFEDEGMVSLWGGEQCCLAYIEHYLTPILKNFIEMRSGYQAPEGPRTSLGNQKKKLPRHLGGGFGT